MAANAGGARNSAKRSNTVASRGCFDIILLFGRPHSKRDGQVMHNSSAQNGRRQVIMESYVGFLAPPQYRVLPYCACPAEVIAA